MKVVNLARVAAGAEALRFKRQLMRYGRQIVFLTVAAVFGLFTLVAAHVVLWVICYGPWNFGRVWASVTVFIVDLIIAMVLVILGRGKLPDPIEIEARITRDRTISELQNTVTVTALTSTITGPVGKFFGRSVWTLLKKTLLSQRQR